MTDVLETANGLKDTDERELKRSRLGMGNPSYFQPGPMNSAYLLFLSGAACTPTSPHC